MPIVGHPQYAILVEATQSSFWRGLRLKYKVSNTISPSTSRSNMSFQNQYFYGNTEISVTPKTVIWIRGWHLSFSETLLTNEICLLSDPYDSGWYQHDKNEHWKAQYIERENDYRCDNTLTKQRNGYTHDITPTTPYDTCETQQL